jgi:glycosyltransferase involved in cell wall biosynthesis
MMARSAETSRDVSRDGAGNGAQDANGTTPRVLVLTTYYHPVVGGVEAHARQLVSYLHRHGFGVEVVTKRIGADDPADTIVDDVPIHHVGPAGERRAAGKWLALPAFLQTTRALAVRFDVIVCIDYRGIGIAAIAAGRAAGVPVIIQGETAGVLAGADAQATSGLAPESVAQRTLRWPARAIYRRADHVICIGRDLEREALRAGVARERVHYLPHGVDLQRFRPAAPSERDTLRAEFGWPTDRLVALFVGRLSQEKGVMDLLAAWQIAGRSDALLVLVGPDMTGHPWDAGAPGRAFVASHQLAARVRFEGPSSDPARFYRAADIFVQPSHFEALGNTALEAMASGLPIVTSGVGGLADFCVDDANALLYAPRSPESMAAALGRMLDDAALRRRLGAAGQDTVARGFELNSVMDQYASLIKSTVRAH